MRVLPIVVMAIAACATARQPAGDRAQRVGLFLLGSALGALSAMRDRLLVSSGAGGVRRDYESVYALGLAFTAFATAEPSGEAAFSPPSRRAYDQHQDVEMCDCFLEYGEARRNAAPADVVAFGMS